MGISRPGRVPARTSSGRRKRGGAGVAVLSALALTVLGVGAAAGTAGAAPGPVASVAAPTTTNTFAVSGTATPAGSSPSTFGPGTLQATVTATGFTDGALTLPSTTYTGYRLFGFLPTTVTAHVATGAPVTGTITGTTLTVTSSVTLVVDQISVVGVPLITPGATCRTVTPSTVTLTGGATILQTGGDLTGGSYTAAPFTGCGVFAPALEPLLDASLSRIPADVAATLGAPVPAQQTITFTSTAPTTAVVGDTYTPTATSSSGLPVTFGATGSCTITGGVVTFTGAGNCTVTADQAGDANYTAAPQVTQGVAVGQASQIITFTSTAPTTAVVGDTYTPTATATSGLPVVFGATGSCTITGGVVTFTGAGTCTITANQAGNPTYAAAPQVTQVVTVGQIPQTITFTSTAPASAVVGDTYTPTATASSGLPVSFGVTGSCTITRGTVTFTGAADATPGQCLVSASQDGNAAYLPASTQSQSITIAALSLSQYFTSTNLPTVCAVHVRGTGFKPSTTFATTSILYLGESNQGAVDRTATSDANGNFDAQLFTFASTYDVVTSIGDVSSSRVTISC